MAQSPEPVSPALVFQRLAEIAVGATARIETVRGFGYRIVPE